MAHKTRMNGTNYEISGGKTLVNGTAYSIDKGKTLVGGTVYEVAFGLNLEVPEGMYLTFSSADSFTIAVNSATKTWNGALYYSTNATEWSEWDGTTAIASATDNGEQRLYVCGTGNSKITGSSESFRWVITGNTVKCIGNIECILDYETVANGGHPVMANYCFAHLFKLCSALTTAPSLPATTLASYCYQYMFSSCSALTTAPSLPATTLASYCYQYMFNGCSALTTAPSLPATTLATYCYSYMFNGCSALTTAPSLPATTLTTYCYSRMFSSCSALTTVPILPATTLATHCYSYMFRYCTKIKVSSDATGTYTKTYRIPYSGTGTSASNALRDMFSGTGGTFTGNPSINTTYYLDSSNSIV